MPTGLIIVVVIVVVLFVLGCLGIRQSRRALEKTAADMGLSFQPAIEMSMLTASSITAILPIIRTSS